MSTKPIRFMANNFMTSTGIYTYSSQLSTYPFSNIFNDARSRIWKTGGNFEIAASNKVIYIYDGSNKTVTLTEGTYTYSTLASHIQTQLNASSSLWTVTYSLSTFRFTISRGASGTLRFSQTTNAAWDTLGFTASVDDNSGPWPSDEIRIHTSEWIDFDFQIAVRPTFLALISGQTQKFTLSSQATVRLRMNNVHSYSSAPIDIYIGPTDLGLFKFLDDQILSNYRYARIDIYDRMNSLGPNGLYISKVYLGDHTTVSLNRNIASGFTKTVVDPSVALQSEGGAIFFEKKIKYLAISGCVIQLLSDQDRIDLENLFSELGKTTPFFVSFDPNLEVTDKLEELTRYVIMQKDANVSHVFKKYYTFSFDIRESL